MSNYLLSATKDSHDRPRRDGIWHIEEEREVVFFIDVSKILRSKSIFSFTHVLLEIQVNK